jgi:DNA processing protein
MRAANEWALALIGRPGIHVAISLRSLLAVIDSLLEECTAVVDVLRRFVSA